MEEVAYWGLKRVSFERWKVPREFLCKHATSEVAVERETWMTDSYYDSCRTKDRLTSLYRAVWFESWLFMSLKSVCLLRLFALSALWVCSAACVIHWLDRNAVGKRKEHASISIGRPVTKATDRAGAQRILECHGACSILADRPGQRGADTHFLKSATNSTNWPRGMHMHSL